MATRLYVPGDSFRIRLKYVLLTVALTLLALTLARPLGGLKDPTANESRGLDVVLIIDISRSMLVQDGAPDRLQLAISAMSDLLDTMGGDRIAVIIFKGQANLVAPLTYDKEAVRLVLENLSPEMIGEPGTNIGEALVMAAERFSPEDDKPRAAIIISDGENLDGDPVFAARTAALSGLHVFTVGVGTVEGGGIPVPVRQVIREVDIKFPFVRLRGRELISKLDESMLRRIALAGTGEYVHITQKTDLTKFYSDKIESLSSNKLSGDLADYEDLSYIPLMIALLTLTAHLLLRVRSARSAPIRGSAVAMILALLIGFVGANDLQAETDPTREAITAAKALLVDDAAGAVVILQDALIQNPTEPALIYNYALALHVAGDYTSADQSWSRLALEFPEYLPGKVAFARANTNHRIGETALQNQNFEAAVFHLRESMLLQEVAVSAGGVSKRDIEANRVYTTVRLNVALRQSAQERRKDAQKADRKRNEPRQVERTAEEYQSAVALIDEAAELLPDDADTQAEQAEIRNEFAEVMAEIAASREAVAEKTLAAVAAGKNLKKTACPILMKI
jgi:Ca-activated chloride channel family protein